MLNAINGAVNVLEFKKLGRVTLVVAVGTKDGM